ncbi:MAG: ATP-binding cassette domain-containing protein [Gammaproteobacteria bacterium]
MSKTLPLLQIKDLSRPMLGPVSLSLAAGDCLCITGESGSGKSQLLRAIADIDPHGGELWLDGVRAEDIPPEQWRRQAGLLPPESSWWLPRAHDHFVNGMPVLLSELGLAAAVLEQAVSRLSSGERQRLALLRLLANRPRVLLLDEPTANLDAENTRRVEAVIDDYMKTHDAAVIWVSHDRTQVARVANRHVELRDGRLEELAMEARQ